MEPRRPTRRSLRTVRGAEAGFGPLTAHLHQPYPRLPCRVDPDWLRQRIEAGATVREIAAEAGRSPRGVRYALRRHGIPTPREHRNATTDVEAIRAAWRRGDSAATIAAEHDRSESWVKSRVAKVPRDHPPPASRFPPLNDASWLRIQLAVGRSAKAIAREVGTDAHNVRAAFRRHSITVPPQRLKPLERTAQLADAREREQAAAILQKAALDEAQRARAIRLEALKMAGR